MLARYSACCKKNLQFDYSVIIALLMTTELLKRIHFVLGVCCFMDELVVLCLTSTPRHPVRNLTICALICKLLWTTTNRAKHLLQMHPYSVSSFRYTREKYFSLIPKSQIARYILKVICGKFTWNNFRVTVESCKILNWNLKVLRVLKF